MHNVFSLREMCIQSCPLTKETKIFALSAYTENQTAYVWKYSVMIKDNPNNDETMQTDKYSDKKASVETWDTESFDSDYKSLTSQRTTGSPASRRSSTHFGSFDEISGAQKTVQTSCRLPDRFQRHSSMRDPFRFVKNEASSNLARQASEQMEIIEKQQVLRTDSQMSESPEISSSWVSNVESWKNRRKQKLKKREDGATDSNYLSPQPQTTSYTSTERKKRYEQRKSGDFKASRVPSVEKLSIEEDITAKFEQPAAPVVEIKSISNVNRTSGALDNFFDSPKQGLISKTTKSKISKQINEKKIISLQRPSKVKTFGFTICNGMSGRKGVFIATVEKDSVAEANGLEVGDEILEINDIVISGTPYAEIQSVFRDRITLGNMKLKILKTNQTEEEHTTHTVEQIGNTSVASKWSPEAVAETTTTESIQTQGSTRSTTSSYAAKQESPRLRAYDEDTYSFKKDVNESFDTPSQRFSTPEKFVQKETFSKPERPRKKAFSRSYVEETERSRESTYSGNTPAYKSSPSQVTRKTFSPPPVEPKTWLQRDTSIEKESPREPDREKDAPAPTTPKSTRVNVSALKKAFESGNVNKPVVDVTFDAKSLNDSKNITEARDYVEKQMSQLQRDLKDFGAQDINIPVSTQPQIRVTRKEEYKTARTEEGSAAQPEPWNQMRYQRVSQSSSRTENYVPTYESQRFSSSVSQAPVERSEMTINLGPATAAKPGRESLHGTRSEYYDNDDDYLQRRVAKTSSSETNVRPVNRQYYEMRTEQRSYGRRPPETEEHFRAESSFSNHDNNTYTEKYNWSESRTEKMSSISGKERCNACGKELGYGTAMVIETLGICFHTNCFRCSVCNAQLDTNSDGIDVRIRGNRLHCQQCFSTDQAR